jgi:hypothetical protein
MRRVLVLLALTFSAVTQADATAGPFRRWLPPPRQFPVFQQPARGVLHSHTCPRCRNIWWHDDSSFGRVADHTCPRCGYGPVWHKSGH